MMMMMMMMKVVVMWRGEEPGVGKIKGLGGGMGGGILRWHNQLG